MALHSRKRITNINVDERRIIQGQQGTDGDAPLYANHGNVNIREISGELVSAIAKINAGVNADALSSVEKAQLRASLLARNSLETNTSLARSVIGFAGNETNRNRMFLSDALGKYDSFSRDMVRRGQFASDKAIESVNKLNQRTLALSQQSVSAVKKAYESANTSSSDKITQFALIGALGIAALSLYAK